MLVFEDVLTVLKILQTNTITVVKLNEMSKLENCPWENEKNIG